jgi:hypothetical protein
MVTFRFLFYHSPTMHRGPFITLWFNCRVNSKVVLAIELNKVEKTSNNKEDSPVLTRVGAKLKSCIVIICKKAMSVKEIAQLAPTPRVIKIEDIPTALQITKPSCEKIFIEPLQAVDLPFQAVSTDET